MARRWSLALRRADLLRHALAVSLCAGGVVSGCATEDAADGSTDGAAGANDVAAAPDPKWPWLTVIDTMEFTRQKPIGVAPGFDLDKKVSGVDDATTCKKGDLKSPDGLPGIDNEFSKLMPLIEASGIGALEGLVQSTINDGGIMLMMQLDGLDDAVNDETLTLRVRAGKGVPLLGTDGLLVAGQTFSVHPDSPEVETSCVVVDSIVTCDPVDISLPLVVFGVRYNLDVRGVHLRAKLTPTGGLSQGLFGGGVTMASILDIAKKGAEDQKNLVELVTGVLGGAADLGFDATLGECTQVSAVLAFTGVNAFLFEDTARQP